MLIFKFYLSNIKFISIFAFACFLWILVFLYFSTPGEIPESGIRIIFFVYRWFTNAKKEKAGERVPRLFARVVWRACRGVKGLLSYRNAPLLYSRFKLRQIVKLQGKGCSIRSPAEKLALRVTGVVDNRGRRKAEIRKGCARPLHSLCDFREGDDEFPCQSSYTGRPWVPSFSDAQRFS